MRTAVIYNYLIEANIMASIAILLMLPLRRFLRGKLGNRALCFGWLLIAIRLLVPLSLPNPLISTIRPHYLDDAAIRPIAGQIRVRVNDALTSAYVLAPHGSVLEDVSLDMARNMENGLLSSRLLRIYLIGFGLCALWFIGSNVRFRYRLRADRIEPISGKLQAEYEAMCAARGVKPVPVYFTDPLPSACLVGVFRPYIALPLTAAPQEALQVLTHEVCHLKGHDHWFALLRVVCCCVHWFNPLVWLAASLSRTDMELRCDDRVKAPMNAEERQRYAAVLVLAAARRDLPGLGVLATGMTMTGKKLKGRVQAIMTEAKPVTALTMVFMVVASACLVGAFATAEMDETLKQGEESAPIQITARPNEDYISPVRYEAPALTEEGTQIAANEIVVSNVGEAIAYAQRLWGIDELREDAAGGTWSAVRTDNFYDVVGTYPDGTLEMYVYPDGHIMYAWNSRVTGYWALYDEAGEQTVPVTEEEVSPLAAWCMTFVQRYHPDAVADWQDGYTASVVEANGRRVAAIDFLQRQRPDSSMHFEVDITSTWRIIAYGFSNG